MSINNSFEMIERLADILKSRELGELEVTDSDISIRLKAKGENIQVTTAAAAPTAQASAAQAAPAEKKADECGNVMTSPIIGTFYSSPAPGKPVFAPIDKAVEKGDVVFIIESMKLMNEVQSDFSGKVAEIYVRDGQTVEFGQPIMRFE